MIKMRFKCSGYDDIFIQIARGYIPNLDVEDTTPSFGTNSASTTGTSKYDTAVLYESPEPLYKQIKDVPSFTDFTSDSQTILREYVYEHNSKLKLIVRFMRFSSNHVNQYGIAGTSIQMNFYYNIYGNNYANVNIHYANPSSEVPMQYARQSNVLAYDVTTGRLFALNPEYIIITKVNTYNNNKYYSGLPVQASKGTYTYDDITYADSYSNGDFYPCNPLYFGGIEWKHTGYPYFIDLVNSKDKGKYPNGDDDPEFPDGDEDDDSDDIDPDPKFPITPTGFITMYNPSTSQLNALASYMWSKDFVDIFLKLMQNPYDAIISLKTVCCSVSTGGSQNIILGNVKTEISCAKITQQYQQIDCGTINLTRYFGNFLDFNPYTSIKVFLPFVGFRELDVDEVMGASLHLYYNVDLLTGSCVALINVTKKINGTNLNSVLYQFDGMIATEIPVTASDYSQVVSAVIKGVATVGASIGISAATGGTGAPASGALLGSAVASESATAIGTAMAVNSAIDMVSSKINVQHGGSLGASMGALATKRPYIIIQRVIEKNPSNYASLHGIPSNAYKKLSTLKGFTQMQDIQIKSTIGSVDETEEIKQLLLGGVVI